MLLDLPRTMTNRRPRTLSRTGGQSDDARRYGQETAMKTAIASNTITRADALQFIAARNGKFFAVRFIKRTTGETREMSCRQGVKSHLSGGEPAYDFQSKGLIPVYDMGAGGYRSIPVEGITAVKVDGEWVEVV